MYLQQQVSLALAHAVAAKEFDNTVRFVQVNDADIVFISGDPCTVVNSKDGDACWASVHLPGPDQVQLWMFPKDGDTLFVDTRSVKVD